MPGKLNRVSLQFIFGNGSICIQQVRVERRTDLKIRKRNMKYIAGADSTSRQINSVLST